MLNKNPLSKLLFLGVFLFNCNIVNSESLNECIKKAVLNKIELNKILTICRENINPINVYSNDYAIDNSETKSDFIFTNTMDSVINEFIEKGDLSRASRLAERQEIEKTKRIKARAEAEALRSPQIIATNSNSNIQDTNNNVRSILSLNLNPIATVTAGSKILEITTPGAHGAIPGQYVQISNVEASIDGIAASEINKFHVISSVPSTTTFRISVLSSAASGSISGGGSKVLATFQN
mgnify:CR=1 FL=1|tara:strand:+ start:618 stop:1328 length:711 start_codon:yes stop_codon:yes gene_type:complete